jgi:hypothetical protein
MEAAGVGTLYHPFYPEAQKQVEQICQFMRSWPKPMMMLRIGCHTEVVHF